MLLLRANGTEIQRNIAEVDPLWLICGFGAPDCALRAGVSSSFALAVSSSSSAPSAVVEGVDPVACTVAGRRCRLGGILRGLCGGVLETENNRTDILK